MHDLRVILAVVCTAVTLSACISYAPAPVVERRPAAKPTAPPVAAVPAADTYVVKRGDTLYSIALDHGMDWRELAGLNLITDPTKLSMGQVLRLRPPQPTGPPPAEEGVVVSPIPIGPSIAARPLGAEGTDTAPGAAPVPLPSAPASGAPAASPSNAAGTLKTEPRGTRLPYSEQNLALLQRGETAPVAASPKPEAAPAVPKTEPAPPLAPPPAKPEAAPPAATASPEDRIDWGWPANGKIVATFDGGSSKGVDIGGRVGDPVYASAPGKVVYSGEGIPAYGKLVIIRHNNLYLSAYAHNSQILVKEGQSVAKGQKIAELGSTGASQAKLHFEIRRQGKPVDPMQYLPSRN